MFKKIKNSKKNIFNFTAYLSFFKEVLIYYHFIFIFLTFLLFLPSPLFAEEVVKIDLKKGEEIAKGVCAGCHALDGNSAVSSFPILAGQHSAYLEKQLHNFQVKPGDSKAMRENAVMLGLATTLKDEDISNVSHYYSLQKIKPSYTKDIDLASEGEKLYKGGSVSQGIPACSSCHGPKGLGIPSQYPRLSGQYAEYTKLTLLAYKNMTRANNNQMMVISSRLSERQINALSEYLAGLR